MQHHKKSFGALLADFRKKAGSSQMALALDAGISARHLSFLEIGRSKPSESMVLRLAATLRLGPGNRDRLLLAAGFAPKLPLWLEPQSALSQASALGSIAFETALALDGVAEPEAAVELAALALKHLGIEQFMTGTLWRDGSRWRLARDLVGRPALGWIRHIELHNYRAHDPLLVQAQIGHRGFFWEEIERAPLTAKQRRVLDEAEDFGIGGGFVMPVQRADGSVRAFSSWAERIDCDAGTRLAASLLAMALMETLERLDCGGGSDDSVVLASDCRAVLGWLADGGSLAGWAERQSITLEESVAIAERAAAMMGTRCPLHAASRAIAQNLMAA